MIKSIFLILILFSLQNYAKDPLLSFVIFSDNHGDGPEKPEFERMNDWIKNNDSAFVIGLGDHVRKNSNNSFLKLLKNDDWWYSNFYPVIADNENQNYGTSQADWGSGKELFGLTDIHNRENVEFSDNGAEYYAVISKNGIRIHFIALHYPDQPSDDELAFKENSRQYLTDILNMIDKKDNDIIIAGAHSRLGYWLNLLNTEQTAAVNGKLDLALSATTHIFHIYSEKGSEGPLAVNTGSITNPRLWSKPGFIHAEIHDNPFRIEIFYIDCSRENPSKPLLFSRAGKEAAGRVFIF